MPVDYKSRLKISIDGDDDTVFKTSTGLQLAKGYERVVLGDRGPYIEFTRDQLDLEQCHIPEDQKYRLSSKIVYYIEYRSNDDANVKVYSQLKTVKYADYKIGYLYVSPFDLYLEDTVIITKLGRRLKC